MIRDVAGVEHDMEAPDMPREPVAIEDGNREDKYAPLRRRDHFTVITGEGGEPR